jgi:hypothetical protein
MNPINTYIVNQLHSDKLIEKYGSINISVIKQDDNFRLAELKDSEGVLRTYAITIFPAILYSDKLMSIHQDVKNGSAIGQTIMEHGCDIAKRIISNFTIDTPNFFKDVKELTSGQLSEIYCRSDTSYEYYAEVCEIYCPSFKQTDTDKIYINEAILEKIQHILFLANIHFEKLNLTL